MALYREQRAWLMPTREMKSAPPHPPLERAAVVGGSYFLIKPADGIRTLRASLLHTFCSNTMCFPFTRRDQDPHVSPKSVKSFVFIRLGAFPVHCPTR